ncbi:MAG: HDOD domain-containing protein [Nitrospirae bacterium]|nr:HDOD domain-containing protein [Nitrospirota bacterium]
MPLDRKALQQRISDLKNLPPLPAAIQKISQMVDDPHVTAQQLSGVISRDQALAGRVLRLVNSPLYGFPGKIQDIAHAVVLLGFNVVKGLAFSTFVSGLMAKEIKGLWEHSLGASLAAGVIARKVGYPKPDEATVAGLLHDLGKVVLKIVVPHEYKEVLETVKRKGCYMIEAEREVLGEFDHTAVGADICVRWKLPPGLKDVLQYHHVPGRAKVERQITAVVHVADMLVRALGCGSSGDPFVPLIDRPTWDYLQLKASDLDEVVLKVEDDIERVKAMFQT